MSDETPGAGQGALPSREGQGLRPSAERPAMRLTQVAGGQYVLTSQPHGIPALAQISPGALQGAAGGLSPAGMTRIISISPSRLGQTSPLRPSVANQSIVNVLKSRPSANVRLQLFQGAAGDASGPGPPSASAAGAAARSPLKRPAPTPPAPERRDTHAAKMQRVMNHRIVRSKLVKEKFNEHLMETYFLESGGNILDLYQFAKRPKTQAYLSYLKENSIDPKDNSNSSGSTGGTVDETALPSVPVVSGGSPVVAATPSATAVTSLPGHSGSQATTSAVPPATAYNSPEQNNVPGTKAAVGRDRVKTPTNVPSTGNQEQIVEKAKQEAYVVQRIADLQKEGLWSEKRLPKVQEMPRTKAHWDFLLEEMVWLAADFAQERKWKKAAAKRCARMVQKYFQDKALAAQRAEKAHEQHLRRLAAFCAKEIRNFWNNVEKLVEYKQHTILEEKRKQALDQQLSFIVDQTEKYSQLLAEGMNRTAAEGGQGAATLPPAVSALSSASASRANSDDEFRPEDEGSTDDEETIAQEEEALDEAAHEEEIEALQKESEMELCEYLGDYLQNRDKIRLSDDDSDAGIDSSKSLDDDFAMNTSEEEDDEETIQEQEEQEGEQNYKDEIEDLNAENQLSIEELKQKYNASLALPPPEDSSSSEASESEESEDESGEEQESEDVTEDEREDEEMEVSEDDEEKSNEVGLKLLLEDSDDEDDDDDEGEDTKTDKNNDLINDAAAIAESIQPKGNTLSSTSVSTKVPFLLKLPLREYQHIGLDWLVTMYERKLNGILADEMGLGKTIQTIALLGHLACEKENWGPHLIVVPTSVMLNWEMECKKWCPAFKILTYYGTQKERKLKRIGWTKANAFHICITSYKLVIQDHQSFRRKKWKYLILDEAQNIKNFKSQRWQLLLNFQTQQRLLLTGTPLQNNLMELWSLMHFLMPNVFQSHREFKEWFSNPVTGMIEGNAEYNENIIKRLHKVLRPFLLRRLKSEVEKQMPKKYEHVVMCRLSKRQRFLYDDYMSRAKTRETLAAGNLLSVINVLMQLRKVCNHPNLFEVRPTISPFQCEGVSVHIPSVIFAMLEYDPWKQQNLYSMNLDLIMMDLHLSAYQCYRMRQLKTPSRIIEMNLKPDELPTCPPCKLNMRVRKLEEPKEAKQEKKQEVVPKVVNQNMKLKVGPQYGVQLIKAIPVVNFSQATTSGHLTTPVTSVLKPSDKISASFAQLVQTSTGKHLLLTSNPNLAANMSVTTTSQGQKLALITKGMPTASNSASLPKTFVKLQLTSVPAVTTFTTVTTTAANSPAMTNSKIDENSKEQGRKTVGSKFIDELYNNLKSVSSALANDTNMNTNDVGSSDDEYDSKDELKQRLELMARINERRCAATPLYGKDFQQVVKVFVPNKLNPWSSGRNHCLNTLYNLNVQESTHCLRDLMYTPERRISQLKNVTDRFILYVPSVKAKEPELQVWHPAPSRYWSEKRDSMVIAQMFSKPATPLHPIASAMVTQFPDPRLIQYDCGKLQTLDRLLRRLKSEGHRVLIFTQMTKMLDVLEAFLNFHGHIYLRLDGSTKVDQRQVLMERFNGDTRIFVFILSTRSGGVGVNLTGADTVIFYDSDWNPTMDAQAQDRCHRIGQTRDVHIYRLVSERTIEENILKKANQKRLLGDLAIEGGNFTTAYFKSSTIQELFTIDANEESAANRMSEVVACSREREKLADTTEQASPVPTPLPISGEDKVKMGALENAFTACEDDQDVQAARTAKAEAVADLAEFDENIPLEDADKEPEMSKAEQEIDNVIKKLSPIERYAMKFIEETESAWSAEQLAAAQREIEEQKREWEQNRLAAMREEEERRARELEEEGELLTFSREDATNQIWVSDNTMEQMPMWCPPTPPQQDGDVYIDHTMSFLYDVDVMLESQLPAIYIKKDLKRSRLDAGLIDSRRALKVPRKEETVNAPKSIFHSPHILKMRRDLKLQKFRGLMTRPIPIMGKPSIAKPAIDVPLNHEWTIHEDMAILKVIQTFQGLPLNLLVLSPGHTPNWDFVADYVNTVSIAYRSPKQCRYRYESALMQREEGKQIFDSALRKKKNKAGAGPSGAPSGSSSVQKYGPFPPKSTRPMRTSQLYTQDNNAAFSQVMTQRYDLLKGVASKRVSVSRPAVASASLKNPKHTAVLNDCGIDIDHPVPPVDIAVRRAERLAREKKALTPEQQMAAAARLHMMKMSGQAGVVQASAAAASAASQASSSAAGAVQAALPVQAAAAASGSQATHTSAVVTSVVTTSVASAPGTPPNVLRTSRIIGSPIQTSAVVSVSGLSPAQLQAATQRLIVSGASGQTKAVVGTAAGIQGKTINQAQLQMIRQATLKQHLRLQPGGLQQAVKNSTVTIGGQQAVVQFSQAQQQQQQQQRPQFVRQGTVTVGKGGITRTVSDEVAQLIKKQQQIQQQKAMAAAAAAAAAGTQSTTIQSISPQVFAQAIQAGSSGTQVATLVKAVSSSGVTQTVSIPVTGVTLATPSGKTITPTLKTTNPQQLRQLQLQQQLLAQKKLSGQKLSIAQVGGKNNIQTQLIVGPKPLSTAMTVQQFQQVIRSPLGVSQTPVVLAKSASRVIPVNTAQGTKQTIQVVTANSQALNTALRPQGQSTLAGALSGIKVPTSSHMQQALLSQVSVALQNQSVRQGSPVRLQTQSGTPVVAVSVQSASGVSQQQQQQQVVASSLSLSSSTPSPAEQVSRYMKK